MWGTRKADSQIQDPNSKVNSPRPLILVGVSTIGFVAVAIQRYPTVAIPQFSTIYEAMLTKITNISLIRNDHGERAPKAQNPLVFFKSLPNAPAKLSLLHIPSNSPFFCISHSKTTSSTHFMKPKSVVQRKDKPRTHFKMFSKAYPAIVSTRRLASFHHACSLF